MYKMEWLTAMNQALDYIEENLTGKIDYKEVAKRAGCSEYHFTRMFSFITSIPLSEYVRRRKLTLAAFDLADNKMKVIDAALKYGYDSPDSFNRAFTKLHGTHPSKVTTNSPQLKAYPKLSFHISIKGDVEMNYRIEEKQAFKMAGIERIVSNKNGENFIVIPKFWEEFVAQGMDKNIHVPEGDGFHAIMGYGEHCGMNGTLSYMIGVFEEEGIDYSNLKEVAVPAATWAVFCTKTSESCLPELHDIWKRIFSEWFPSSSYEHAPLPECEIYNFTKGSEYAEVWIPVIKKEV